MGKMKKRLPQGAIIALLAVTLVLCIIGSVVLGRYPIGLRELCGMLGSTFMDIEPFWKPVQESLLFNHRLPRILLACLVGAAAYIASSALFGGLIDVLVTRFLRTEDFDSFTTGRMTLWQSYMDELFGNIKVFFLGHGFTNVMINERASHSTVIQIFYQFGLLGVPVLIYWIVSFFRINTQGANVGKVFSLRYLMIYAGVFGPWLALDLLFFDEFSHH
jgi:hypothetical protein